MAKVEILMSKLVRLDKNSYKIGSLIIEKSSIEGEEIKFWDIRRDEKFIAYITIELKNQQTVSCYVHMVDLICPTSRKIVYNFSEDISLEKLIKEFYSTYLESKF